MDKIEIIIRHKSASQTQQFYGVNHYEPEEALRRFHAISAEANDMHWRLLQDSYMEESPMLKLLELLKDVMIWIDGWEPDFASDAEWLETESEIKSAIAKAERGNA